MISTILVCAAFALAAFAIGWAAPRKLAFAVLTVLIFALGQVAVTAGARLAQSGLAGGRYFVGAFRWPLDVGLGLFAACLALAGPIAFGRTWKAIALSIGLIGLAIAAQVLIGR